MTGIGLEIDTIAPTLCHWDFITCLRITPILADKFGIDFCHFLAGCTFFGGITHLSRCACMAAFAAIEGIFCQFGTIITANALIVCTCDGAFPSVQA